MTQNDVLSRFNSKVDQLTRQEWELAEPIETDPPRAVLTRKTQPSRALRRDNSQGYPDGIHVQLTVWIDENNEIRCDRKRVG